MSDTETIISPCNLEAEKAVLGAVLVNNQALLATELLRPSDFFRDAHVRLYAAMLHLVGESQAIDIVTLAEVLGPELDDVGGRVYIASLIDGVPRSSNVEHHATIVQAHARARRLIAYARQAIETFSADPAAIGNGAGGRFMEAVRREIEFAQAGHSVADRFTTAAESCRDRQDVPMLLEPYIVEATIGSVVAMPRSRSGRPPKTAPVMR